MAIRRFVWFPDLADDLPTLIATAAISVAYLLILPFALKSSIAFTCDFTSSYPVFSIATPLLILILQMIIISKKYNISRIWWVFSAITTSVIVSSTCAIVLLTAHSFGLPLTNSCPATLPHMLSQSLAGAIVYLTLVKLYFSDPEYDLSQLGYNLRKLSDLLDSRLPVRLDDLTKSKVSTQNISKIMLDIASGIGDLISKYNLVDLIDARSALLQLADEVRTWPPDAWNRDSATASEIKSIIIRVYSIEKWS